MTYQDIIGANELLPHVGKDNLVLLDCRRTRGPNHINGAQMVDFEKDLTGQIIRGVTGRHPLPRIDKFSKTCSKWGINETKQVVVYDENSGAWASRLWWMLKWLGHKNVAVLNGGWDFWNISDLPTTSGFVYPSAKLFQPKENRSSQVQRTEIHKIVEGRKSAILLDARAAERYRGEHEPIDPIAGHIPTAVNLPFGDNLNQNGLWRSKEDLKQRLAPLMSNESEVDTICYCGSGITACHNILAAEYAGYERPRLYAGSWSDWINTMS